MRSEVVASRPRQFSDCANGTAMFLRWCTFWSSLIAVNLKCFCNVCSTGQDNRRGLDAIDKLESDSYLRLILHKNVHVCVFPSAADTPTTRLLTSASFRLHNFNRLIITVNHWHRPVAFFFPSSTHFVPLPAAAHAAWSQISCSYELQ